MGKKSRHPPAKAEKRKDKCPKFRPRLESCGSADKYVRQGSSTEHIDDLLKKLPKSDAGNALWGGLRRSRLRLFCLGPKRESCVPVVPLASIACEVQLGLLKENLTSDSSKPQLKKNTLNTP